METKYIKCTIYWFKMDRSTILKVKRIYTWLCSYPHRHLLTHCLACGTQFYSFDLFSWPSSAIFSDVASGWKLSQHQRERVSIKLEKIVKEWSFPEQDFYQVVGRNKTKNKWILDSHLSDEEKMKTAGMCLEWNQQGGRIIICHFIYSKGISIRQEDYHILNDQCWIKMTQNLSC